MAQPKRYFLNKLLDYSGQQIGVSKDFLKKRCLDVTHRIFENQGTRGSDCDGGLYVGVAGVSYMSYYISQLQDFGDKKEELLHRAENYLKYALGYVGQTRNKNEKQVSFLLEAGGVYALAALVLNAMGKKDESGAYLRHYADLADFCLPINFLSCGSDELFVGRAGYLCGLLLLNKKFNKEIIPSSKMYQVCNSVIQSGREYSRKRRSPSPLMYAYYGTEYLGAAHGLSSILQMLLSVPGFLSAHPDAENDVKGAVDFLLSLQTPGGNFPCAMDEVSTPRPEQDELVHWCHGAPGTVYLMAKAYLHWREDKYLQSCLRCGEIVWKKGLLRKGPGICHGVAGSGYVFLLLYRLTSDSKHYHRALQFSDFLFTDEFKKARTPDCPYSLYEGLAGTACFLGDLLHPDASEFPLFNVF